MNQKPVYLGLVEAILNPPPGRENSQWERLKELILDKSVLLSLTEDLNTKSILEQRLQKLQEDCFKPTSNANFQDEIVDEECSEECFCLLLELFSHLRSYDRIVISEAFTTCYHVFWSPVRQIELYEPYNLLRNMLFEAYEIE